MGDNRWSEVIHCLGMDTRNGETWNVSGTQILYCFIVCNILYYIVERFSLIFRRRHGWLNHVKT